MSICIHKKISDIDLVLQKFLKLSNIGFVQFLLLPIRIITDKKEEPGEGGL